jgi:coiled-coil domain-containing protein 130
MSSLAATQADGYYVPPEYFESGQYKHKSKNQFAGSKGHNQYLQKGIVRFELPYKSVCGNCHESIARGTRFNAHKIKTEEAYFTTSIWEFQLSCRKCQHPWKIRTNPKERGFDYVEGVTIQAGQDDVVQAPAVDMTSEGIATNLERLESIARGERNSKTEIERLQAIQQLNSKTTLEDSNLNAVIRKGFRSDRKHSRLKQQEVAKVGWREGMHWLNASLDDQVAAKTAVYGKAHDTEQRHLNKVRKSSIFDTGPDKKKKSTKKRPRYTDPSSGTTAVTPNTIQSFSAGPHCTVGGDQETSSSGGKTKQKIQLSVRAGGTMLPTVSMDIRSPQNRHGSAAVALTDMLAYYGSSDSDD